MRSTSAWLYVLQIAGGVSSDGWVSECPAAVETGPAPANVQQNDIDPTNMVSFGI